MQRIISAGAGLLGLAASLVAFAPAPQASATTTTTTGPAVLFQDGFDLSDHLVSNAYAYLNPTSPDAVTSPDWYLTGGSLFDSGLQGYTGVPTAGVPDAKSTTTTGSAAFRLNTKRYDFGDVTVNATLNIAALSSTTSTPAVSWDGAAILLRYQSENSFYYASVARRDGRVVFKKRCGSTSYEIGNEITGFPITFGSPFAASATVRTNPDGTVALALTRDGKTVTATDAGTGCAPITHAGSVGLRGDNAEFHFDNFTVTTPATTGPTVLFRTGFDQADGLVTNAYAFWNPSSSYAVVSKDWAMDSGSLFSSGQQGYSGVPNAGSPDPLSTKTTGSAVFRLNTKRFDFGDVTVTTKLNIARLSSTSSTPSVNWDGIHLWLRYQDEYSLYYASVARRDGHVVIKKKCRGGTENGGTYYELGNEVSGFSIPFGTTFTATTTVHNNTDGSVTISLTRDGKTVTATDRGTGCAPITHAGAVGVRGDNAEFHFDDFTVSTS